MTDKTNNEPSREAPAEGDAAAKRIPRGRSKRSRGKKAKNKRLSARSAETESGGGSASPYPRHVVEKSLRIPKAILEQNAGKPATASEAASFVGVKAHGPFHVELSSASKYGFLERPEPGKVQPSALAKQILRPQKPNDEIDGYRQAILRAPVINEVYKHYRGENLPDDQFLKNTVVDTYKVPSEKFDEFKLVFLDSLERAQLLAKHGDKIRIVDFSTEDAPKEEKSERIKKLGRAANVRLEIRAS